LEKSFFPQLLNWKVRKVSVGFPSKLISLRPQIFSAPFSRGSKRF
jgi:hypothetical protein